MDGSVYVGNGNAKQRHMAQTAALLGYAAQYSNDLFTGVAYTPHGTITTPPTKQLFDIEHFSQQLYTAPLLHTGIDLQTSVNDLFKRLHKPSLVLLLHDFLEPVEWERYCWKSPVPHSNRTPSLANEALPAIQRQEKHRTLQ